MGVYVDISFQAKLTDFGYEIVQELYRNRNEGKLPTVELYQEEEYDDDGNLIVSKKYRYNSDVSEGDWISMIEPVDSKEYNELDIINGKIVGRR